MFHFSKKVLEHCSGAFNIFSVFYKSARALFWCVQHFFCFLQSAQEFVLVRSTFFLFSTKAFKHCSGAFNIFSVFYKSA
jgi:hypothetical protein